MNTDNKFNDNDVLVVAMNVFLKLVSFSAMAMFVLPLVYVVSNFVSILVNIVAVLLGVNLYTDWLGICMAVVIIVTMFYVATGRYKNVYFRSWTTEDRDGYYQDFEVHL